jgi:osmotically-inducible protein OsmY
MPAITMLENGHPPRFPRDEYFRKLMPVMFGEPPDAKFNARVDGCARGQVPLIFSQRCSEIGIRRFFGHAIQMEATMKSDSEIERDVKEELKWEPGLLDVSDIAVSVKKGVVTLAGFVRSYTDKYEAEAAAKRVAGVAGVANDLEVRMPSVDERPDPEIARDAVAAIKSQLPLSWERIKVVVKDGWVNLEG